MTRRIPDDFDVEAHIAKERAAAAEAAAAATFVQTARAGKIPAFLSACEMLSEGVVDGWTPAFKLIAKEGGLSSPIRDAFFEFWVESKSVARLVEHDFLVIDGLRVLLPPYDGPAQTLYRGESFERRRRRLYGISWTLELGIAEQFATDPRQMSEGGSVVLRAHAPPDAIIATTHAIGDHYNEDEYLIDRRKLRGVTAIKRFEQAPRPF